MNKLILFLASLILFVCCASAQKPPKPSWPDAFSASVFVKGWGPFGNDKTFFRWFVDDKMQKSRMDGMTMFEGEWYMTEFLFDHRDDKQWQVYLQEGTMMCFEEKLNKTMPKPDFNDVLYAGVAVVNWVTCNHWLGRGDGVEYQYYESVEARQPVRLDWMPNSWKVNAIELEFTEFDECRQDDGLYVLPKEIADSCNMNIKN